MNEKNFDEKLREKTQFYQEINNKGTVISIQATDDRLNIIINNTENQSNYGNPMLSQIGLRNPLNSVGYNPSGFCGISIHGKQDIVDSIDVINSMLAELRQHITSQGKYESNEQH